MSARQRARILNQAALLGINANNVINESEDDTESETSIKGPAIARDRFCFDSTESSNNSESSSDEELELSINTNESIIDTNSNKLSAPLKSTLEDYDSQAELAYLNDAISQQAKSEGKEELNVYFVHQRLFSFGNPKDLDINDAMRRRAGEPDAGNPRQLQQHPGGDLRRRHGGRGLRHIGHIAKKYIFGPPSEDWPKPPSFAAGGVGMSRLSSAVHAKGKATSIARKNREDWYSFEYSQEYSFLCTQFQYIETTGDANLLVMFLTHFPYFYRGLLHLAIIYARMGQLEKAVDLSRRALFVFDYASLESFRSSVLGGKGGSSCVCRMDPAASECNHDYFSAMALHIRICSALGHHTVAAEVGRYALSLSPASHDPGLVLSLDRLLVTSEMHDVILEFCSLTSSTCAARNNASIKELREFQFHSALRFEFYPLRFTDEAAPDLHPPAQTSLSADYRSLEHLPNWWFSLALSAFQLEHQSVSQRGRMACVAPTDQPPASSNLDSCFLLKAALLHWPFMLKGLVSGAPSLKTSDLVPKLLVHPLFSTDARLPRSNSYLATICRVYAARAGSLWHKEEVLNWLVQCATELRIAVDTLGTDGTTALLSDLERSYSELCSNTSINAVLAQFCTVVPEPYAEGFPPMAESPLDPGLDDPEYLLSGAVRFQNFMNPEGEYMFAVPKEYASTLHRRRRRGRRDRHRDRGDEDSDYSNSDQDESWAEQMLRLLRPQERQGRNANEGLPHRIDHFNWHRAHGGMEFAVHNNAQSNIDFSLPIMQLFLSTLFPWIFVRPLSRT